MAKRKRSTSKAAAAPADFTPAEGTTFAPLEARSGNELEDKERAEKTQFAPLRKESE